MKKRLISIFVTVIMLVMVMTLFSLHASASPATAVTLTDGSGEQTILTTDTTTATYSYVAETSTLTLNGWSGRKIQANGEFNLHLIGTNTIKMVDGSDSSVYGIDGDMTVTAAEGGVLNITNGATPLTKECYGIYGSTTMISGTVNIDLENTSGTCAGTWFGVNLAENTDAAMNIKVSSTSNSYHQLYGMGNGSLYYTASNDAVSSPKFALTVDVDGNTKSSINCVGLNIVDPNADIDISIKADNDSGETYECLAMSYLPAFNVGPGSTLKVTGASIKTTQNFYQTNFSNRLRSTTPANDGWYFKDFRTGTYNRKFYMCDMNGNILNSVDFAYSAEELPALSWIGEGRFSLPAAKMDDYIWYELSNYIKNFSNYYSHSKSGLYYELVEGTLPAGLRLYSDGAISGTYTAACPAGTVSIKVSDRMDTQSTDDDRTLTFTLSYGEVVEPDKFITVDATEVEMRENGSGTGWSYDGTTKTLTLENYNGGMITAEKPFNLHLIGINTITMVDGSDSSVYGIDGDMTVTAAEGGVLNITNGAIPLTKECYGIYGTTTMISGTVNIDLENTSGTCAGIWFGVNLAENTDAAMNIKVSSTSNSYHQLYGMGNGSLQYTASNDAVSSPKFALTVDVDGNTKSAINCVSLYIVDPNADIDISIKADNDSGETYECLAMSSFPAFNVGPGSTLKVTGASIKTTQNFYQTYFSNRLRSTTPANDGWYFKDFSTSTYNRKFYMCDMNGNILNSVDFAYSAEELPALSWIGEGRFSLPAAKMNDYIWYELSNYIKNFSNYYSHSKSGLYYELVEGTLPAGLRLYSDGTISGTYTAACSAGTVSIKVSDRMDTQSTADDRTLTFTLSYGRVTSNNPVTALTLDKTELVLDNEGSGTLTATASPADAAYPDVKVHSVNGLSTSVSAPVNAASVITVEARRGYAGVYTLTVESLDVGLTKTATVYVKEAPPECRFDYECRELYDVIPGRSYRITPEGGEPQTVVAEHNYLEIEEAWLDKTISIVLLSDVDEKCNSNAYVLIIEADPVEIISQPESVTVESGEMATVSFTAKGEGLTYKWYFKNSGATKFSSTATYKSNTYYLTMNEDRCGRQVYCVVTDKYGNSAKTQTVTLGMGTALRIVTQPKSVVAEEGQSAKVTFTAEGEGLTYKWYYKSAGAAKFSLTTSYKSNSYGVAMTAARAGRQIYCIVSDQFGNKVQTETVTLYMGTPLQITAQSESVKVQNGETATATVTAVGDGLTYQWYFKDAEEWSFSPVVNGDESSYSVEMSAAASGRQVYCVVTDQYGNTATTETVTLSMATPLQITVQPQNVAVLNGETAQVSVTAVGDGLTYKWYAKNAGATKFSYTSTFKSNVYDVVMEARRDGRQVYCIVTDQYGNTVQTETVTLRMATPLQITEQPQNVTVALGESAKVTFTAEGDGLTYKWYAKNAGSIKFSYTKSFTGNVYEVDMEAKRDGRQIYCIVTDQYGNSVQTETVTLSMATPLQITAQPQNVTVASGESAKVTVTAEGDGLTYKWYAKNAGATKFSYTSTFKSNVYDVVMEARRDGRQVYCIVTDQYGNTVQTETVTLYMGTPLQITAQPQNVTVASGESAKVTVTAEGDGLTYKWYAKNAGSIKFSYTKSFTGNVYEVDMEAKRDGRQIYCIVTDQYGNTVQTETVTLRMATPLQITAQPQNVTVALGESAKVTVTAEGDGLTYKWYAKNAGAAKFSYTSTFKSNVYDVVMEAKRDGRQVYCIVTDQYGNTVQTETVTLSME